MSQAVLISLLRRDTKRGGSLMNFANERPLLSPPNMNFNNNWHLMPNPEGSYFISFVDTNGPTPDGLVMTVEPNRGQDSMMNIVLRQIMGSDTQSWTVRAGPEGSYQICCVAVPYMCMGVGGVPVPAGASGMAVSAKHAQGGGPDMWWRFENLARG
ncbi:uncharacterized protein LAJ45_10107 [Morchella importuna]|uniref:uncharacterized protein n=1 Tax=Morchella importuna TaxID=1174673 RepID=UPI001E8E4498|nr:uncharacterized protein LAJ45_10107 [Morchella importuna]KAH8145965.1 hypothetical protein LAJ45_10107 [Morchella importuna]